MAQPKECEICIEPFTKSIRARIECPKCNYTACKQCVKTYISSQSSEPHCMKCKHPYERSYLIQQLGKSFVCTDIRKIRSQILYDIEKSKLPESMNSVASFKKVKKNKADISILKERKEELREMLSSMEQDIRSLQGENYRIENGLEKTEKKEFIKQCSVNGCKGFLSTKWKCGLCDIHTCNRCHEPIGKVKDEYHVCDEDSIKTVEMINNETKPCPKCSARIFKISGCDQMWCTQCEVAFSWKTGNIQVGVIHNPHYYEARRRMGTNVRNPGDVVCGGIVGLYDLRSTFVRLVSTPSVLNSNTVGQFDNGDSIDILLNKVYLIYHRSTTHNIYILDRLRQEIRDLEQKPNMTRVKYIIGELDDDKFKRTIITNSDKLLKKRRLCEILETYVTILIETINTIYQSSLEYISENGGGRPTVLPEWLPDTYSEDTLVNPGWWSFYDILNEHDEKIEKIKNYTEVEFFKIGLENNQATYGFDQTLYTLDYKRFDKYRMEHIVKTGRDE
jgi:hypothetical protein